MAPWPTVALAASAAVSAYALLAIPVLNRRQPLTQVPAVGALVALFAGDLAAIMADHDASLWPLLAVTQVMASLRFPNPELLALLGGRQLMSQFPYLNEIIEERVKEKVEEAVAGKSQDHILKLLASRFGTIPDALEKRLRRVRSAKRLDTLFDVSTRCADLAAFEAKLRS